MPEVSVCSNGQASSETLEGWAYAENKLLTVPNAKLVLVVEVGVALLQPELFGCAHEVFVNVDKDRASKLWKRVNTGRLQRLQRTSMRGNASFPYGNTIVLPARGR